MAGLARRARASEARAINEGSHVPAFDLVFRRRRALSLAIPDYGLEEIPPPNSMSESTSREHKAGPVQIALGPQSHQTFAGALATKYRDFCRTFRCLAIEHLGSPARREWRRPVQFSSQLFRAQSQHCTLSEPLHPRLLTELDGVAAIGQSPAGKKVLITYVISTSRRHGALISLTQTWLGRSIATPESRYG
jgi:hypothetical protein